MSNQPNYYPPTPPNNQPNSQDPYQGQYQQAPYGQNPYQAQYPPQAPYGQNQYQAQYPPQAPYGQNPYQAQYQPVNYPYQVPNLLQIDPKIDRRRSNIAFGLCIVGSIIGGFLLNNNRIEPERTLSLIAFALAGIAWVTAWCFSTKSKGYSPWLGLVSILGVLGMIVLMVIPNRNKIRY
ncbi:hypothetical protein [Herpetosiphon giganteus]|uniref:hypothetical protein n=1 Tax=Herpetosiphon giganteus TaxID=2029754 RepID=UPI00195D4032|nr:hypothetical protein [Herpetosiphon giganteus]MBM7846199.1 hypothetical protein [Herpetosiphon giganteus]